MLCGRYDPGMRCGGVVKRVTASVGARWRGWSWWRRVLVIAALVVVVVMVVVGVGVAGLLLEDAGTPAAGAHTRGRDAYWLGHAWAEDYGHHGNAETVPAGPCGIRLGLGRTAPGRESFGVAMYVDFTATSQNWSDYRRDWGAGRG